MRARILRTSALVLFGVSATAGQEQAPAPAAAPTALVKISVGDTAAPPEWELSIPVAINVAYGTEAGGVSLRIRYPAKALKYLKVKTTESFRDAGYAVAIGKPVVSAESGSLTLEVAPSRPAAKPLPSGTAAILVFKVATDAPEKTFPIGVEDIRAWGPQTRASQLTAASARAATFIVTPPGLPILSCFFYMH